VEVNTAALHGLPSAPDDITITLSASASFAERPTPSEGNTGVELAQSDYIMLSTDSDGPRETKTVVCCACANSTLDFGRSIIQSNV